MTIRAAIYARFSSDKQQDRSIDDQVALCRRVAEREGMSVIAVYDDRAISGASVVNRLGWQRLMRDAKAGHFTIVIAEALDRISRDQEDLAGIYKRLKFEGIGIVTAQDGLASDIHVGVKGMLGALYLKDLADKTRRGQAGVVNDGRHNGGRSFGYVPVPGKAGELKIDEREAATVRRIFENYVAGASARTIASKLNAEGIAGPRGGVWNASTINGSRVRRNGILQNELYGGRIIWNRQRFIKDPDTGKRISRPNPQSEWMASAADHLRIVDDVVWTAAQSRKAERSTPQERRTRTRPQHLLSGLLKCGVCGSSYIVSGSKGRGGVLGCSRSRETGLCTNRRKISRGLIEDRVIEGLEANLAAPDVVAAYVREFHKALDELNKQHGEVNAGVDRELKTLAVAIGKTVDAITYGTGGRALVERLAELERRRDQLEAQRITSAPPVQFHPNAAEDYRRKVQDLQGAISAMTEDNRAEVFAAIRELVEKIVIHPRGPRQPVDLEIHGRLASMLRFSEAASSGEPMQELVAGTGFEPVTFRL